MNRKRLIVIGTISIILVCMLFIGTTYSIFTSNDIDPNANVYTTGNLDITYTLSSDNVNFTDATPVSDDKVEDIKPYRITVNNMGNVDYKFNIILTDTTATDNISYDYIMTQVGKLDPISLSSTTSNIIKSDIIIKAGTSVPIDIRIYLSSDIPNTEVGKNFTAKLSIDGIAVSHDKGEIDNSDLVSYYNMPLSEVSPGSYVQYTGNNGCSGASCSGQNANYVSDTDMGYCRNSSYKFTVNGWRVGYISDGTAYLVSAGALTCLCTKSDGTVNTSGSNCSNYQTTKGAPLHIANLNNEALKYCNSNYAYGGVCNSSSAWSIKDDDFNQITGSTLSNCYGTSSTDCGLNNTLIDNGGYYWYATPYNSASSVSVFKWRPVNRTVDHSNSNYSDGVRPVLRLQSSVQVTGGSGTYEDPYTISPGPKYLKDVEPGSYVAYAGNNGCSGASCSGQNANYVSDTDMGYCFNSNYKFTVNGWRVGYISDGTAYLVSAGAPECVASYIESVSSSTISINLSANYYYGSGYYLNPATGYFELRGVTSSTVAWSSNYDSIINDTPYTCKKSTKPVEGSTTGACTTLYKIKSYGSSTNGVAYEYYNYERTDGAPIHLDNLNSEALKYCNSDYAYGESCNESSARAMNATDFKNITGSTLSNCYKTSSTDCGLNNTLIDNGGYYWYATPYNSASSVSVFKWRPVNRTVDHSNSNYSDGVRPVLRLQSSVQVTGGSGTYEDPYQISNR